MNQYGNAAVRATNCYLKGEAVSPRAAWESAIFALTESHSSRKKSCPRDAYLGLCEAGLVKDIPARNYGAPPKNINGQYAVNAYHILKSKPNLGTDKKALWAAIPYRTAKNQNGQLDVVLTMLGSGQLV